MMKRKASDSLSEWLIWILNHFKKLLLLIPGGGGHFHINLYGTCRFSGYHFSALIPEPGMRIDQKFRNRL